ncbi:MAG: hypothetical protein ACHQRJ_17760 [Alphaproteobacteria bacterium]
MPEKHVVAALVERRARVAGELQAAQIRVMRLRLALGSSDACIRMFKANYNVEAIRPKVTYSKNPARLPKGTGSRKALDVLRQSGEALTSQELARRILVLMDRDTDERAVEMLAKTIHSSFSRQKNPVVSYDRGSWPGKWRLLPP